MSNYLFLNRILRQNIIENVMRIQISSIDKKSSERDFQEREKICVRNYSDPRKFKFVHILNNNNLLIYKFKPDNEIWCRYVDRSKK